MFDSSSHGQEKTPADDSILLTSTPQLSEDEATQLGIFRRMSKFLLRYGIETHGVTPIPAENRTDKRLYQMFILWFTVNFNILAFGTGSAGPAFFSLGMRDSALVLLVVDVITCAIPAYFAVFGPKLGTRGMVQARFSWGLYGAALPSVLNVISMQGFLILNSIIGGQTLAAVSDKLDDTLGIVIIGVIALVVTFFGYRVVHWFETFAWIPNVIAFPLLLGLAGKRLDPASFVPPDAPATPSAILSFGSLVGSSVISWCTMTADYGVYHDAEGSTFKIFIYSYLGFFIPSICWHLIGAACTSAARGVPSWAAAFDNGNNVGGLFDAILKPAGGFGKFMLVLIALSTSSACAPTMYTFGAFGFGLCQKAQRSRARCSPDGLKEVLGLLTPSPFEFLGMGRVFNVERSC